MLRVSEELEPLVGLLLGPESSDMALVMRRRAEALQKLNRFEQATTVALESLRIGELASGRGKDYVMGLVTLAAVSCAEGSPESLTKGLKHIREA